MAAKLVILGMMIALAIGHATASAENFNDQDPPIDCGGIACCDLGLCTLSCPPQCRCRDVKPYCHAACKDCFCTKSNPPRCRCNDITAFSYAPCPENGRANLQFIPQ